MIFNLPDGSNKEIEEVKEEVNTLSDQLNTSIKTKYDEETGQPMWKEQGADTWNFFKSGGESAYSVVKFNNTAAGTDISVKTMTISEISNVDNSITDILEKNGNIFVCKKDCNIYLPYADISIATSSGHALISIKINDQLQQIADVSNYSPSIQWKPKYVKQLQKDDTFCVTAQNAAANDRQKVTNVTMPIIVVAN